LDSLQVFHSLVWVLYLSLSLKVWLLTITTIKSPSLLSFFFLDWKRVLSSKEHELKAASFCPCARGMERNIFYLISKSVHSNPGWVITCRNDIMLIHVPHGQGNIVFIGKLSSWKNLSPLLGLPCTKLFSKSSSKPTTGVWPSWVISTTKPQFSA